ncbi:MAG: patatin-like phospholipase family protein [Blastocatellales bacterium]
MKYDLVFEGGGAKGMVFVGACQEFFDRGHTFDRLLGTSAGAITAALMAAGYRPEEMLEALTEKENGKSVFAGFMAMPPPFSDEEIRTSAIRRVLEAIDIKLLFDPWEKWLDDKLAQALAENEQFRHVLALIERGGWYAADPFITWLEKKLDSGTWSGGQRAFSKMTLSQLFDATGVELSVVASDTTDGRLLVLNHRTAPDCPVVWAVRMSMSIPLVWDEVVWKSSWGQYLGRDMTDHAIVDGGLLSNFPIELFISDEQQVVKLMGPKKGNPVLGMLIDEQLPVPMPKARGMIVDVNIKPGELRTVQRLQRLANAATSAHDKMVIDEFSNLIVRLPAAGYGTTEFEMSDERRMALVNAGRSAMASYFDAQRLASSAPRAARGAPVKASKADRIATAILQ